MADFDRAVGGINAHVGGDTGSHAGGTVDDGVEQRVVAVTGTDYPLPVGLQAVERSGMQIGKCLTARIKHVRRVQICRMALQIQRFDAAIPSGQYLT